MILASIICCVLIAIVIAISVSLAINRNRLNINETLNGLTMMAHAGHSSPLKIVEHSLNIME